VDRSLGGDKLISDLMSVFGLTALLLASIGIYGIMAYAVAQRTNEIGTRMALGARRLQIVWTVLGDVLKMVALGLTLGIPVALAVSRVASSLLFGLEATDPATMSMAICILSLVAAFAGYLPARRAARMDPVEALRYE
jgi:ABC-type antimicrobial peptide transport system permease subunit